MTIYSQIFKSGVTRASPAAGNTAHRAAVSSTEDGSAWNRNRARVLRRPSFDLGGCRALAATPAKLAEFCRKAARVFTVSRNDRRQRALIEKKFPPRK
jgi:hypothetical protein